jgi:cell division protein FtsQ
MVQRRRPPPKRTRKPFRLAAISPGVLRLAVVVALLLVVVGGVLTGRAMLNNPENMRISQIDVQGELKYLKDTDVRVIIGKYTLTNLYLLDAQALEADLETLPWVRVVRLHKVWPSRLVVQIEEQRPVAFWGADRLMNEFGELFSADLPAMRGIFPLLYSPEDKGREMAQRYLQVREWLKGLPLEIAELTEDESGAWRIKIKDGPEVLVGNDSQERRLKRLRVGFQQELAKKLGNIRRIDLRYTNGFAVEWKQPPASALDSMSGSRRS